LIGAAFLLLCGLALGIQAETFSDPMLPEPALHADLAFLQLALVVGKNSATHFDAFGMDNAALERSAANLKNPVMSSTQRVMNYQWLSIESNELHWQRGSSIVTAFLKSKARSYFEAYRAEQSRKTTRDGSVAPSNVFYDMDMSSDSLEFSVIVSF